ncbi:MAG TPA: hypothetical protein VIV40_00110 [Kofleriaceae bacterium]
MASSKLHPFIRPAEEYEHPQSPVRDDAALGSTEDLDREPDGVPHTAVALTALLAFAVAIAIFAAVTGGSWKALIVIPLVLIALVRWAAHRRNQAHPSI